MAKVGPTWDERWALALPVGLLLVAVAIALFGGGDGWGVLLEDGFSAPNDTLTRESNLAHQIRIQDGLLLLVITRPHKTYAVDPGTEDGLRSLRVKVDAGLALGSKVDDYYGVSCFSSRTAFATIDAAGGYAFEVNAAGRFRISRNPGGGDAPIRLAVGSAPAGLIKGYGYMNTIEAECLLRRRQPTLLRLEVNGKRLAETQDIRRPGELHGALLLASSSTVSNAPLSQIIFFDNLVMSTQVHTSALNRVLRLFTSN